LRNKKISAISRIPTIVLDFCRYAININIWTWVVFGDDFSIEKPLQAFFPREKTLFNNLNGVLK